MRSLVLMLVMAVAVQSAAPSANWTKSITTAGVLWRQGLALSDGYVVIGDSTGYKVHCRKYSYATRDTMWTRTLNLGAWPSFAKGVALDSSGRVAILWGRVSDTMGVTQLNASTGVQEGTYNSKTNPIYPTTLTSVIARDLQILPNGHYAIFGLSKTSSDATLRLTVWHFEPTSSPCLTTYSSWYCRGTSTSAEATLHACILSDTAALIGMSYGSSPYYFQLIRTGGLGNSNYSSLSFTNIGGPYTTSGYDRVICHIDTPYVALSGTNGIRLIKGNAPITSGTSITAAWDVTLAVTSGQTAYVAPRLVVDQFIQIAYFQQGANNLAFQKVMRSSGSVEWGTTTSGYVPLRMDRASDSIIILDDANGPANLHSYPVPIDRTAPAMAITQANLEGSGSTTVNWTATDASGTVNTVLRFYNGSSWSDLTTTTGTSYSWTYGYYTSQSCKLRVVGTDVWGLKDSAEVTFTIADATDPAVSFSSQPSNVNAGTAVTATIAPSDANGGSIASREYKIDAGSYTTLSSNNISWTPSEAQLGIHTITVRVTDQVGRTKEVTSSSFTVVDATRPTVSISTSAGNVYQGASQAITWSASDGSGSATSTLYKDGSSLGTQSSPYTVTMPSTRGNCVIKVVVADLAGNKDSAEVTFTVVDSTKPVLSSLTVPGTILPQGSAMTITWSASDNDAIASRTVEYQLNGGSWQSIGTATSDQINWTPADTAHTAKVRVTVADNEGNTTTTESGTFTLVGKPDFTSSASGTIQGYSSFAYKMTYSIPGSPDTLNLTVLEKPEWITVTGDSIKGTAPNQNRTDQVKVQLSSGGLRDTLTLSITIEALSSTGIMPVRMTVPFGLRIENNTMTIGLDKPGHLRLLVLDAMGRSIVSINEHRNSGYHRIPMLGRGYKVIRLEHEGRRINRRTF